MFNITDSSQTFITTNESNICLACLFNGATQSTSGTVWTAAFGQPIRTSQNVVVVNPNGTLLISLQAGATNTLQFSCQINENILNIIVSCESHVFFCSLLKYLYYAAPTTPTAGQLYALLIIYNN